MVRRALFGAALILLAASCVAQVGVQRYDPSPVELPEFGITIDLPAPHQPLSIEQSDKATHVSAYRHGDMAFLILVFPLPKDSLGSTAIEQQIQRSYSKHADSGDSPKRWELDNRDGKLFKGLSWTGPFERCDMLGGTPIPDEVAKSKTGAVSVSLASVGDELSPVLGVMVLGAESDAVGVENAAKFAAYSVRTKPDSAEQPTPAPLPVPRPQTPDNLKSPPSPLPRPADQAPPKPTALNAALQKGEIRLAGIVSYVASDGKRLQIYVDEVTMPESKPTKLSPVRPKSVLLRLATGPIRSGDRIVVVGKNEGVGKPITADLIEVIPKAAPPAKSN